MDVEEEEEVVIVFDSNANESSKIHDDEVINESNVSTEIYPDISEVGIHNFCKVLESDFAKYSEKNKLLSNSDEADVMSDYSDEEVTEKGHLIVHRPLKTFATEVVLPLSKELFGYNNEVPEGDVIPGAVLICSLPGIGYLKIIEQGADRLIIEDPINNKVRHKFLNNGHASNWLDRFFQYKMTFDENVVSYWPRLHHTLTYKLKHFDPEILKDKKLIVTENGVKSLQSVSEAKRFCYRRKLIKYAKKLAYLVCPDCDFSTLSLSDFLKKVMEAIPKEEKTLLCNQYKIEKLTKKRNKLKMELSLCLTDVKQGPEKTKALKALKRIEKCSNPLGNVLKALKRIERCPLKNSQLRK